LLWTLEQGLGDAFTPETKDAWVAAYTILAETMIAPAEEELARQEARANMLVAELV